jgi:hypothetical protein
MTFDARIEATARKLVVAFFVISHGWRGVRRARVRANSFSVVDFFRRKRTGARLFVLILSQKIDGGLTKVCDVGAVA